MMCDLFILFQTDSLVGGHDDGFVDILGETSAGEVVNGSSKSLENRTYSLYTAQTLHELVGDVAHFE